MWMRDIKAIPIKVVATENLTLFPEVVWSGKCGCMEARSERTLGNEVGGREYRHFSPLILAVNDDDWPSSNDSHTKHFLKPGLPPSSHTNSCFKIFILKVPSPTTITDHTCAQIVSKERSTMGSSLNLASPHN